METYLGILILYIDEMLRYWIYYFTLFWFILSAYRRVGMIELFDYIYIWVSIYFSNNLFTTLMAGNGVDMLPIGQGEGRVCTTLIH